MLNKIKFFILNHRKVSTIFIPILLAAAILLIGTLVYKKYFSSLTFLNSLTDEQQISVGKFIGEAYKNIYGYKTVCKTENIILEKFPAVYKQTINAELNKLNQILQKDGLTLEGAISLFLPYNEMNKINNFLYKELRNIANSDDKGVKSACLMLEEQADYIAKGLSLHVKKEHGKTIRNILK